ncbi:MAG: hypothetical protein GX129_12275 [Clostridiales bacterium]|jgi:peroxiredoxin-like protein|nr:hypothetical protein [Clostridiales bacterium]
MKSSNISFNITGRWEGNRNGSGVMTTNEVNVPYSAPASLDGPGIGSNPEELLMASASTCYMITLAAILSRREINYLHLEIDTEGIVLEEGNNLIYKEIIHKPVIFLKTGDEEKENEVIKLAHRAEKACFISQTIKPQVTVNVVPKVKYS